MSFKTVLQVLNTQLSGNTTLQGYVESSCFLIGFKEPVPQNKYLVVLEPGNEEVLKYSHGPSGRYAEKAYNIKVYARIMILKEGVKGSIIGSGSDKGLLEFIDDIVSAILSDLTLGYNTQGQSISSANSGSTFALTVSARYLSIKINSIERTGWTIIDCGSSTLAGATVASNIQAALRALSKHSDDGYENATCEFSSSTKKFTIKSGTYGPTSTVVVTAGASNDCSSLLGFDSPTETRGKKVVSIKFGLVQPFNNLFPVRYRILDLTINEEVSF